MPELKVNQKIRRKELPEGFVFLTNIDSTIIECTRYATDQNFLGRPVKGYKTNRIVCTEEAAQKLKEAHKEVQKNGYRFVVYDGYRPQAAVDEFKRWGQDLKDITAKNSYYPTLTKEELFHQGYVPNERSMHSRGSTFDLTLIREGKNLKPIVSSRRELLSGEEITFLDDNTIDMGSSFDLFHEVSHHDSPLIKSEATQMRNFLRQAMSKNNFKEYHVEWWHYTLENEPYPDTYFDFIVET